MAGRHKSVLLRVLSPASGEYPALAQDFSEVGHTTSALAGGRDHICQLLKLVVCAWGFAPARTRVYTNSQYKVRKVSFLTDYNWSSNQTVGGSRRRGFHSG